MSAVEQIRHAISSSSATTDLTVRVLYTSVARSILTRAKAELEELDRVVSAQERELSRLQGSGQLEIGGDR